MVFHHLDAEKEAQSTHFSDVATVFSLQRPQLLLGIISHLQGMFLEMCVGGKGIYL